MTGMPRRRVSRPTIGMAPLIDCMLLLLIFFLLTSTFTRSRGIRIELPSSSTAAPERGRRFEITVERLGQVSFEGRPLSMDELSTALQRAVKKRGKLPVLLVADRRVPVGTLTAVIDRVRAARLETVAIATRREDGREAGEQ